MVERLMEQIRACPRGGPVLVRFACGGTHLCVCATGFFSRMHGLLGAHGDRKRKPLLLAPCSSIHTFGMAFPIDAAFIDDDGGVLEARREIAPGRVVSVPGAVAVLERASVGGAWPHRGDRVAGVESVDMLSLRMEKS